MRCLVALLFSSMIILGGCVVPVPIRIGTASPTPVTREERAEIAKEQVEALATTVADEDIEAEMTAIPETTATPSTTENTGFPTISVENNLNGTPILVDNEGFPFYTFTGTEEPATLTGFQRVEAGAADTVGAGLDVAQVGAVERENGFRQLTYADRPLYRYIGASVTGPHSEGEFANVGPQGELVGEGVGEDPGG